MAISQVTQIGLALALLGGSGANCAELPSRQPTPRAAPVKTCDIDGKPGYRLPGSEICMKMSGYVSGQVAGPLTK